MARPRPRVLTTLLISFGLLVGCNLVPGGEKAVAATTSRSVYIYGDSLMVESQTQLVFQLGLEGVTPLIRDYGGTALCDWIPTIRADVASAEPRMVVLDFSGNALTACMAGTATDEARLTKYRSDLDLIAGWLHSRGIPLVVVGAPPAILLTGAPVVVPTTWSVGQLPEGYAFAAPALNDMYLAAVLGYRAEGWDASFVPAGTSVSAPDGHWTYVLPCLSFETSSRGCNAQGLITVRSPDFAHFCPPPGVGSDGSTGGPWVSGGWRYAAAISSYLSTRLPIRAGFWTTASDGGVSAFGPDAGFYGSTSGAHLYAPVVAMAADPVTGGYWLAASDGGVFAFHSPFYGSVGGARLAQPVAGIAATPDGRGYWLVSKDGGVFSFGPSAHFYGSAATVHLTRPVAGMAADTVTGGYRLVTSDGRVFAFHAPSYGSVEVNTSVQPIVAMASAW